jgi:CRP-like cAMP-binding protein
MQQIEFLRLFHNLPEEDYSLLRNRFSPKIFRRGDLIIRPGQIQKGLLFVNAGVQMSYFESDSKDHVVAFTYPPNLCTIPESFSLQMPSRYYLKCLTDSKFDSIHFLELQELFEASQELERLFRKMTEAILAGVINRHIELQTSGIEERFRSFCQRSPHLLQLVPHKYIASYLNIDSTNFSKLFNTVKL